MAQTQTIPYSQWNNDGLNSVDHPGLLVTTDLAARKRGFRQRERESRTDIPMPVDVVDVGGWFVLVRGVLDDWFRGVTLTDNRIVSEVLCEVGRRTLHATGMIETLDALAEALDEAYDSLTSQALKDFERDHASGLVELAENAARAQTRLAAALKVREWRNTTRKLVHVAHSCGMVNGGVALADAKTYGSPEVRPEDRDSLLR